MAKLTHENPAVRRSGLQELSVHFRRGGAAAPEDLTAVVISLVSDPAGVVQEMALSILVEIGDPVHLPVFQRALGDTLASTRQAALRGLGTINTLPALSLIARMKKDPSLPVRMTAVQQLDQSGQEAAIPGLTAFLDDPISNVQLQAAMALAKFASKALPAYEKILKSGQVGLLDALVRSLQATSDPGLVPFFVRLASHATSSIRLGALAWLGASKDGAALPVLTAAAKDPDVRVRVTALQALGETEQEKAGTTLTLFLRDPDVEIRTAAISAVAKLRRPEMIFHLIERWEQDDKDTNRHAALQGVLDIRHPQVISLLVDRYPSANRFQRQMIVTGIQSWGEESLPLWVLGLRDPHQELQLTALSALINFFHHSPPLSNKTPSDWMAAAAEILEREKNLQIRLLAIQLLGYGGTTAFPRLEAYWRRIPAGWSEEREGLVRALAAKGESRGIEFLTSFVKSADRQLAQAIFSALAPWGESALPALEAGLTHSVDQVRFSASDHLIRSRSPLALEALRNHLTRSTNRAERLHLIQGISGFQDPRVIPDLRALLRDADPQIREAAKLALTNLGEVDEGPFKKRE